MANEQVTTQEPTLKEMMIRLDALAKENQTLKIAATLGTTAKKKATTTVKINGSGGLFFSAPNMQAYSDKKQKTYQLGINIHGYQLEGFYAFMQDKELQAKVMELLSTTTKASVEA